MAASEHDKLISYDAARRETIARMLGHALHQPDAPDGPILEFDTGQESILGERFQGRTVVTSNVVDTVMRTEPPTYCSNTFSAIMAGEYLPYFREPDKTLRAWHDLLQPHGSLIFNVSNLARLQDRLGLLIGHESPLIDPIDPVLMPQIRVFTARSLRRFLELTGFESLVIKSDIVSWRLPSGRTVGSRWLAKTRPALGDSFTVLARKSESSG